MEQTFVRHVHTRPEEHIRVNRQAPGTGAGIGGRFLSALVAVVAGDVVFKLVIWVCPWSLPGRDWVWAGRILPR